MATAKDSIGNVIAAGDKVLYKMQNGDTLIATVHEIVPGNSVVPGGQLKNVAKGHQVQEIITPGEVRMIAQLSTQIDPRDPVGSNLVKVYDPEKDKKSGLLAH